MDTKKMLLVFNPDSGKAEFAAMLFEVTDRFTKAGFEVTVHPTQAPRDAFETVSQRASDFDYVCCSGGDGTLNEVVSAIVAADKKPVLGYIPSGTTNDFATSLGIPKNIMDAAETVVSGIKYPIDIGRFGGGYFAYVAAFGLFTTVPYDTPQSSKNILGHAAYVLEGVKRLRSIEYHDCEVYVDGKVITGNFIFGMVSNSTSVGGFKMHSEELVHLDDGEFELLLIKRPRSFVDLQNIAASLLNNEIYTESLIVRKAANVRVVSKTPINWTLDGEFGGKTQDVTVCNLRRALEIMTPKPKVSVI